MQVRALYRPNPIHQSNIAMLKGSNLPHARLHQHGLLDACCTDHDVRRITQSMKCAVRNGSYDAKPIMRAAHAESSCYLIMTHFSAMHFIC